MTGLQPLEFVDCYSDSPWFRQSISEHEDELTRVNNQIKSILKVCQNFLSLFHHLKLINLIIV